LKAQDWGIKINLGFYTAPTPCIQLPTSTPIYSCNAPKKKGTDHLVKAGLTGAEAGLTGAAKTDVLAKFLKLSDRTWWPELKKIGNLA